LDFEFVLSVNEYPFGMTKQSILSPILGAKDNSWV